MQRGDEQGVNDRRGELCVARKVCVGVAIAISSNRGAIGMKYTARQLAMLLDVQTSTITRQIDKGKISAGKNDQGNWEIDASEIVRVYGDRVAPDLQGNIALIVAKQSEANSHDCDMLQMEIEFLKKRLADREKDLEKAEQVADRMHELFKDTVQRLEAPRSKGWLARLFGA